MEERHPSTSDLSTSIQNEIAEDEKPKPPFWGFGILCGILAGLIYSFNSLLVKLIHSSEAFQLSASRCIIQSLILVPYASYNLRRHKIDILGSPKQFKFLLLRAITGSTGSIFLYQSIQRISVGDSVTLVFTSTIFTAIMAYFFLHEPLTIIDGLMIMLTMVGVVLISKPTLLFGGGEIQEIGNLIAGVIFGLCSGLLNACAMVSLRKLGTQKCHPSLNILYYSLIGSFTSTLMVIIFGTFQFPCFHELPFIILLAITGIVGQMFVTFGLQYERAAVLPAIRSLQIVFIYIMQVNVQKS